MIELPTTAIALRTFAKELGLKGMSSANKTTLVPAITEELERRAAAEKAAAKSGKLCSICGKRRPTTKNGKDFKDQCDPCHIEAGWENTHGDANHAAILAADPADRTAEQGHETRGAGSASRSSTGPSASRRQAARARVRWSSLRATSRACSRRRRRRPGTPSSARTPSRAGSRSPRRAATTG